MNDNINHPSHYCRDEAVECIEEMRMFLTREEYIGYLKGNILKYRYRAADKNGLEDLKKSDWYARELKRVLMDCVMPDFRTEIGHGTKWYCPDCGCMIDWSDE